MFGFAVFVLIVAGIVWLYQKSNQNPPTTYYVDEAVSSNSQQNETSIRRKIATEIRAQAAQYKSAAQKQTVEDMAHTVEYFAQNSYEQQNTNYAGQASNYPDPAVSTEQVSSRPVTLSNVSIATESVPYETPWKKLQFLDGAVILLYLGAFFVLSSIGLFIGFGTGTTFKAVLVSVIAAVFYSGGIALYKRSSRLKPAGQTFVAIGMATIPMAGAALYYFALGQTNGPLVWFMTSLVTLGVYAHALYVLRSPLVSYMIVFSTISLVLSGVSSVGLAPFYFIQGLGFAGLLFAVMSRFFSKSETGIAEAYEQSAAFLVPFSMGLSVLFIAQTGLLQLALSLLLGAGYYAYAAIMSLKYCTVYVGLAQGSFISAVLCGTYGLSHRTLALALVAMGLSALYSALWLGWSCRLASSNAYRRQVIGFMLGLPTVAGIFLLGHTHLLWTAFGFFMVQSFMIYVYERDQLSGLGWILSLLALPALVGLLAFSVPISLQVLGFCYLALMACSVVPVLTMQNSLSNTDITLQQILLISTLLVSSLLEISVGNGQQLVMMGSQLLLLTIQAYKAQERSQWFVIASVVQLVWLLCFFDAPIVLFCAVSGVALYNLAVSRIKNTNMLHSWIACTAVLVLPAVYGIAVSTEPWHAVQYGAAYAGLFVLFFGLRLAGMVLERSISYTSYIISFSVASFFGYMVNPKIALVVSVVCAGLLLLFERVESEQSWGYVAPLMPLGVFVVPEATHWHMFIALIITTVGSVLLIAVKRRLYEAAVATVGILVLPWFMGVYLADWPVSTLCYIYTAIATLFITVRLFLVGATMKQQFHATIVAGYGAALCIGLGYALSGSWMILSFSLFMSGLALVAISYIEDAPWVIAIAFASAYAFLLRYTTGLGLTMSVVVGIFVIVSQAIYWLLVLSKLETLRAKYAHYTQLVVALAIPIVGLFGYGSHAIFPFSLICFGAMLCHKVWRSGQSYREIAISIIHGAVLWWLYLLGVREVQVYTQSTALLIGCFAFWRRQLQESVTLINQYIWTAVLVFSIPMVYQALTSGNLLYAYLVLVEHVILTVVSIGLKRATFAWWGITIIVASVLYQLRQLRYVALAFLGVFIIAMAVYFLLKYNKPPVKK